MHPLFNAEPDRLRMIYDQTRIHRSPISGIVSGYHTLPFTLVGPNDGLDDSGDLRGSLKLTGKISVSPKLVIPISAQNEQFADIFPEAEPFMDRSITQRVFSFRLGTRKNLSVRNEFLTIEVLSEKDEAILDKIQNELSRGEIINHGVIWCPEPRFYPVSLERFIVSVLDREFK